MQRKCQWRLPLKSKIPKQRKKTAKEQQRNLRTSKNWNKCQLNWISCVESSPYNYEMRRYPWTMGLHTHFHSGIARHLIEHTLLCVYPRSFSLHFFYIFFHLVVAVDFLRMHTNLPVLFVSAIFVIGNPVFHFKSFNFPLFVSPFPSHVSFELFFFSSHLFGCCKINQIHIDVGKVSFLWMKKSMFSLVT